VLITKEPGYMLTIDPQRVDFLRFEQGLAEARRLIDNDADTALAALDESIQLWRGDALADFAYETFARAEIDRLDELRLEALELRFDARLQLGHTAELIGEMETLSRQNPYRERPVAQLMTALYRAGRQTEALRAFERHRRALSEELGIEPSPELRRLEEQILLHDDRLMHTSRTKGQASEASNPYKGLHAFQEADAANFYGRERLLAEMLRRLGRGDRLLALVGPSGSGKSSVVRAGLIPAVRKGAVAGTAEWLIAQMVPGAHPFAELEAALLRTRTDVPDSLAAQLADGDQAILRAALRVLPSDDTRLLLVIDQLEELFTLVDDRDIQRRFLDGLVVVVDDPHERVTVVVTLRADFYDRPLLHPAFGARLGEALVNVTPLSAHELEEAASVPATMTGVSLEPSLLGRLIGDVVDHPGALPMFQYTLTELFERRAGDVLGEASYDEIGGVRGAITHRAEDLFGELGPEEQEAARQLFLRLVSMSSEGTWSRRRVRAGEIVSLDVDVVALQAVIDRFGSRRLLFFDRDRATGAPTVEVGHEALLTEWERLGDWIRAARTDLVRHASFVSAVDDWERSGRDLGYLVTGSRLAEYEKWAGASCLELNARELQFLGASLQARELEVRADRERTEREVRLDRRSRRRLWAAVAAVVMLAVLVGGFVVATVLNDTMRVAVVTTGQDDALSALLMRGVEQAAADLPVEIMDVIPPITDLTREYRRLAAAGVKLIIVPASLDLGALNDVAAEMPDVTFVSVMAFGEQESPNVIAVMFAEEQAGFLAGVAAATETTTGIVGFVGGVAVPDVEVRRAGFEAGVAFVDPSVTVLARHIAANGDMGRAFQRTDLGKAAAADLFSSNADVVYHAAGRSGLGVFQAAREYTEATGTKHWGIGSDSDQILEVGVFEQDYVLLSVLRKFDVVASNAVKDLVKGELKTGVVRYTFADGGLGYSRRGDHLSDLALSRIEQAEANIIDGTVAVPLYPVGDVLPPLEAPEPVGTIEVAYNGTDCTHRYDGPEVVSPGQSIRIVTINDGATMAWSMAFAPEFGAVASVIAAEPNTTQVGYFVATDGRYELSCGTESTAIELMAIEVG
jgi:basic membrane lipoprotein Med (substrate-binding protein (PBP1-ABC) superfamily)/tetratricopeptide (TPR) repeat protein